MTNTYRRKKDGAMFRNTKILEPRKSYLAEVETYGEDRDGRDYHERNVLLHMKNSDLERWCQEEGDYDELDDNFYSEFNYDIIDGKIDSILNELIGDRMGFEGELTDYQYTITKVVKISEICGYNTGDWDLKEIWVNVENNLRAV